MIQNKLKIGGYVRISRDEDKTNYGTIISQKDKISHYTLDNFETEVLEFYEDDNVSGYSLERPAFSQLVKDIEDKKIEIVIAKDLSRIGRHNAHVLLLVEELKSKGVKLICIDDNFDSDKDEDGMLGIKTWFNERYIKDISKKIKSNIKTQMRMGDYKAAIPYGFKRDSNGKIVVNTEVAEHIKSIFIMYLDGDGCRTIGRRLDESGVPTPSMLVREDKLKQGKDYKKPVAQFWDISMIHKLLTNDFYTGKLRYGKFKMPTINGKAEKTNEEDQIIFENNHEAIIDVKQFEQVQLLLQKRKEINYRGDPRKRNLYSGFLFCEDCNSPMSALNKAGKNKSYICGRYNRLGKRCGCGTHYILDKNITAQIRKNLKIIRSELTNILLNLDEKVEDKIQKKENFDASIKRLEKDSNQMYEELKVTVSQKIKEIVKSPDMSDMISKMYEEIENEKRKKIEVLNEQVIKLKELRDQSSSLRGTVVTAMDIFDNIINKENFEKRDLEFIIKKIVVGVGGVMEIYLKEDIEKIVRLRYERTIEADKAGELSTTMYHFILECKNIHDRYVGLYKAS